MWGVWFWVVLSSGICFKSLLDSVVSCTCSNFLMVSPCGFVWFLSCALLLFFVSSSTHMLFKGVALEKVVKTCLMLELLVQSQAFVWTCERRVFLGSLTQDYVFEEACCECCEWFVACFSACQKHHRHQIVPLTVARAVLGNAGYCCVLTRIGV